MHAFAFHFPFQDGLILLQFLFQCEKEYHVGCLRSSGLCDLKVSLKRWKIYTNLYLLVYLLLLYFLLLGILMQELPKDKWFCCDDCSRIHMALQNSVSIGAEIVPASLSHMILRKHADKGLFIDGAEGDIQWRILSGKSRYPEHLPFLSRSAAIFRVSNFLYHYQVFYSFPCLLEGLAMMPTCEVLGIYWIFFFCCLFTLLAFPTCIWSYINFDLLLFCLNLEYYMWFVFYDGCQTKWQVWKEHLERTRF